MGGVNVKKGLWATLFNYLGIVVGYANTFWLMPKYMDLDKIGEFRVIYGTMLLLVPFIQLGSSNVVLKFSPKQPKSYLSNLFSLLTYLQLTLFFGILLIYTLFPDILLNLIDSNVSFNKGYLYAAFPILLTTTLVNFFVAILRSQFREISASFSQTIGVRTVLLIATVCFILTQNITFMYYAVSIGLTLLMIPQLYVIIFKCKIPFKLLVNSKDLDIKEILKYGGVVSVTAASSIIIQNTDVLMTNKFLGFEKAGIYTIIFSISAALDLPRRILSQFLVPHVSHAWKDKNIEKYVKMKSKGKLEAFVKSKT